MNAFTLCMKVKLSSITTHKVLRYERMFGWPPDLSNIFRYAIVFCQEVIYIPASRTNMMRERERERDFVYEREKKSNNIGLFGSSKIVHDDILNWRKKIVCVNITMLSSYMMISFQRKTLQLT